MDYEAMIKDKEVLQGFQELITDKNVTVVKRAVKVFTSAYYNSIHLLAVKQLDSETFLECWSSVRLLVDSLFKMVEKCENEGLLLHLIRFTETSVTIHLLHDLTAYPAVFDGGRLVVKTGLTVLKDLILTPYIGGSPFILAVRSLISIACLRPDLWEPVTDLIKKQLNSLPPTLFDHNVRSFHQMLQRNLFRLLRRADTPILKSKLIEMMVCVGVPRKMVVPWAPLSTPGTFKRDTADQGCSEALPSGKKMRLDEPLNTEKGGPLSDPRLSPSREPRKTFIKNCNQSPPSPDVVDDENENTKAPSRAPSKGTVTNSISAMRDPRLCSSLNLDPRINPSATNNNNNKNKSSSCSLHSNEVATRTDTKSENDDLTKFQELSSSSNSANPSVQSDKSLKFLTSLIPGLKKLNSKESADIKPVLYDVLHLESVISIVLSHIKNTPQEIPNNVMNLLMRKGLLLNDIEAMRIESSKLVEEFLNESGYSLTEFASRDSGSENSKVESRDMSLSSGSSHSTPRCTPPPLSLVFDVNGKQKMDIDERHTQSLNHSDTGALNDRDPRLSRDPRLKGGDHRTSFVGSKLNFTHEPHNSITPDSPVDSSSKNISLGNHSDVHVSSLQQGLPQYHPFANMQPENQQIDFLSSYRAFESRFPGQQNIPFSVIPNQYPSVSISRQLQPLQLVNRLPLIGHLQSGWKQSFQDQLNNNNNNNSNPFSNQRPFSSGGNLDQFSNHNPSFNDLSPFTNHRPSFNGSNQFSNQHPLSSNSNSFSNQRLSCNPPRLLPPDMLNM